MAEITKIGTVPAPTWFTYTTGAGAIIGGPSRTQLDIPDTGRFGSGWIAGEALGPGDACYVFAGAVFRSEADGATHVYGGSFGTATAVQAAQVVGYAAAQVQAGEAVTLYAPGVELNYTTVASSGSVPIPLYLSSTVPGGLSTVPSVAGSLSATVQPSVAYYLGDGRIRIK
jgi:hypothetical protein